VLDFFADYRTQEEFERGEWDVGVFTALVDTLVILSELEEGWLRDGFLSRVGTPVGRYCTWPDLPQTRAAPIFAFFGVPTDTGSTLASTAREGPRSIRRALSNLLPSASAEPVSPGNRTGFTLRDHNLRRTVELEHDSILDLGDIATDSFGHPGVLPGRVNKLVTRILDVGAFPVLLGGDHSITRHAIEAHLARHTRLGVIHFDDVNVEGQVIGKINR
jgi:hypothetical protein